MIEAIDPEAAIFALAEQVDIAYLRKSSVMARGQCLSLKFKKRI